MSMKLKDYPIVKSSTEEIDKMIEDIVKDMYIQDNCHSDKFKKIKVELEFAHESTASMDYFYEMTDQRDNYVKYYKDNIQKTNIIKIA